MALFSRRPVRWIVGAALLWTATETADAATAWRLDIPAGRLADALVAVGEQAHVTVGLGDPALGGVTVGRLHGRMTAARALDRLLRGTRAQAVAVGADVFRILTRAPTAPKASPPAPASHPDTIVVTGSKRELPLVVYPGSAIVTDPDAIPQASRAHGSEALVDELPVLSSTHLGPGRNKLFVRGIADSSFNGPTQSTVGQYLGDARLNYNAPDPDLALYDMASVEVLEGPQGTLYGAGTLGGIIRLVPVMPDLDRFTAGVSLGTSWTRHGAASGDQAGLLNLPIVSGTVGLRVLGYRTIDGGYIDDPGRGLSDINRTITEGGRGEFRIRPAADWTIDITGVVQNIDSRDGQYSERGLPRLQRDSVLPQPFDNDYGLGNVTIRHSFDGIDLTSSTSLVRHEVVTDFDASLSAADPRLFREDDHIALLSNETRLAHQGANGGGWVAGVELLHSNDHIHRYLGPPSALAQLSDTRNLVNQGAVFGEATLPLTGRLFVTAGGRIGFDALTGDALDERGDAADQQRRKLVFLPSAALLWKLAPHLSAYIRYQEGYRAGGLSVGRGQVERYRGDSLATLETGLRLGDDNSRFDATAVLSYAQWKNIQADLVDNHGLPVTANIGDGRVLGFEARAGWRPVTGMTLSGGVFLNDSSLYRPVPAFAGEHDASLPNVADLGAQARFSYGRRLGPGSVNLTVAARYVGESKLDVGRALALPQGHYLDTSAGLRWTVRGVSLSLDATNLLDDGRNQFALGNPFTVMAARQVTPLRPRTLRLGLSTGF